MIPRSPSQTETFLQCPMRWVAEYLEHKASPKLNQGELSALLGTGLHAAAAQVHSDLQSGFDLLPPSRYSDLAVQAVERQIEAYREAGRSPRDSDTSQWNAILGRVAIASSNYARTARETLAGYQITHVEHSFYISGFYAGRMDLGGTMEGAGPGILDLKTKVSDKYYSKDVERRRVAWQQLQYTYLYEQLIGQPCTWYGIIFVIFEPFSARLEQYPVTPEVLTMWHQSALRVWQQMEDIQSGESRPWADLTACEDFGGCPFKPARDRGYVGDAFQGFVTERPKQGGK